MMTPLEMLEKCVVADIPDPGCPALDLPSGAIPLDPNAVSILPKTRAVTIVCSILVGLAIIIRIFTRAHLVKKFALEDAMMILGTIGFFVFVALICDSAKLGLGKHQWNVTLNDFMRSLHRAYAVQLIYCFTIYPVKLGVLLQIKHIFASKKKDFNYWACWAVIVFVSVGYTANLFIWVFPCVPVRKSWDFYTPGYCNKGRPSIISGVVNLASDLAILALPMIAVAKLQMSMRKKLAVSAVFAVGILACAISALRLYYSIARLEDPDYTYWLAVVATCAIGEIAAVLLCGCFPTFPRFYKWIKNERDQTTGYQKSASGHAMDTVERWRLVHDEEKHGEIANAL